MHKTLQDLAEETFWGMSNGTSTTINLDFTSNIEVSFLILFVGMKEKLNGLGRCNPNIFMNNAFYTSISNCFTRITHGWSWLHSRMSTALQIRKRRGLYQRFGVKKLRHIFLIKMHNWSKFNLSRWLFFIDVILHLIHRQNMSIFCSRIIILWSSGFLQLWPNPLHLPFFCNGRPIQKESGTNWALFDFGKNMGSKGHLVEWTRFWSKSRCHPTFSKWSIS